MVILAHCVCVVLALACSLAYAHRRMGGLVVPKCLAFLLIATVPPVLFIMGVVPEEVKAQKLAFFFGEEGAAQMLRGIAGVAFFVVSPLFLLWTYVFRAFHAVSNVLSNSRYGLGGLIFHPACAVGPIAVVVVAACGFFDHSFWRPEVMMLTVAMFAMAGSAFPAPKKTEDDLTEK